MVLFLPREGTRMRSDFPKNRFCPLTPKCVDKKDAQQKHRMKMRRFCVNAKKSRKYSSKSLEVKNLTPFFQNNETGDAKSPFFSIRWVELPTTPRSVFQKGKQPSVVRRNLFGEPQRAVFHFPTLLHLLRLSLIPWIYTRKEPFIKRQNSQAVTQKSNLCDKIEQREKNTTWWGGDVRKHFERGSA